MNDEIRRNYFRSNLYSGINLAFLDYAVDASQEIKLRGTVVFIHGFPETSFQWRAVIPSMLEKGYNVLAPDYRGAGESSKPNNGFTKASMAADIIMLLDLKQVEEPVHVVGHDIGAIVAFALASRWPERVASLCISECLLPGTNVFIEECQERPQDYFHFSFHAIENLSEALISGREKTYIEYFVNRLCYRLGAFSPSVLERYANAYSQPGALRCAHQVFRTFDKDADDLKEWLREHGRCTIPTLVLSGAHSSYGQFAARMAQEVVADKHLHFDVVQEAGHFIAEENPHDFAEKIIAFMKAE